MKSFDRFLEHHVNRLMDGCLAGREDMPPVDIPELARLSGVLSIEGRQMIPEAVLSPEASGFRIYLQSNFKDLPGASVRRRFSLAHEIAHTFFYEFREGVPKPIRSAPRGEKLEQACHRGAGLLLVPERLLGRELRRVDRPIAAQQAIDLSRRFDVSVEVMLRRLNQLGIFESTEIALVLVRLLQKCGALIEFATYPPWLKSLLPTPHRGTGLASWLQNCGFDFRPANLGVQSESSKGVGTLSEAGLQKQTSSGMLRVRAFDITRSQRVFELRICGSPTPPPSFTAKENEEEQNEGRRP